MKKSDIERDAYLQAEITTALAHQIRAIRMQRGWSQAELARRMGTKQHVVSRLENPSYGRYTLQTLMLLSRAFDTGLQVRFISFVSMLHDTFMPSHQERLVPSFEEEAQYVGFYSNVATVSNLTLTIDQFKNEQKSQIPIKIDSVPSRNISSWVAVSRSESKANFISSTYFEE